MLFTSVPVKIKRSGCFGCIEVWGLNHEPLCPRLECSQRAVAQLSPFISSCHFSAVNSIKTIMRIPEPESCRFRKGISAYFSWSFLSMPVYFLLLVQPVSVTAIQISAASAWRCFSSRAGVAEACVRSVATTRLDATASTARTDTPATTASHWATARPANVSHYACVCLFGSGFKGKKEVYSCLCTCSFNNCRWKANLCVRDSVYVWLSQRTSVCPSVQKCLWGGCLARVGSYSC